MRFKQIFLTTTKFYGHKTDLGGNWTEVPRVCGPGQNRRQKVFHWGPSYLFMEARNSENVYLIHNMNSICSLCKLIINIFSQMPIIGS